jgi:polysaccharide export outer membrane protein
MSIDLKPHARRLGRAVCAACLSASLAGCGSTSNHPPAPVSVDIATAPYRIAPLDTLNVVVSRNPELSATVTVRPDGLISTPLVDDLRAAGKSPTDLAREVEKALARFVREPVVSVVVSAIHGAPADQIRIVGEAVRPQAVPYRQDMTVLDAMTQAGGLTNVADGNAAVLVRGAEGGKQYSVRLKDLLRRGDSSANVPLRPGDTIIVPQSWF